MKKWLIALLAICVVLLVSVYILIPHQLTISSTAFAKAKKQAVYRIISDENKWEKWFPGKQVNNSTFIFNNDTYKIYQKLFEGVAVTIKNNNSTIGSTLLLFPIGTDSLALRWETLMKTSSNPFKKVEQYYEAKRIESNIADILTGLNSFLRKQENIYGIVISQEQVKDTVLAMTNFSSKSYPPTNTIYSFISELKNYISSIGLKETNYPMLNVSINDSGYYETRVAIPTNKRIENSGNIMLRTMVPGKILVTEIKGGPATVQEAFDELENYVHDNKLRSPAIPFESLVTDRTKEKDTTKWITKIYYPIL